MKNLFYLVVLLFAFTGFACKQVEAFQASDADMQSDVFVFDDAGTDGGMDAAAIPDSDVVFDAGSDSGDPDSGMDSGVDSGTDDAGMDAGVVVADSGMVDAGMDADVFDAGIDSGPMSVDAGTTWDLCGPANECDDNNMVDGDGCQNDCTLTEWICADHIKQNGYTPESCNGVTEFSFVGAPESDTNFLINNQGLYVTSANLHLSYENPTMIPVPPNGLFYYYTFSAFQVLARPCYHYGVKPTDIECHLSVSQ